MTKKIKTFLKCLSITFFTFLAFLLIILVGSYEYISYSTRDQITNDIQKIEPTKTALVLGTSKYVVGGGINRFFKYRMEAVKRLYDEAKVSFIIVSGDNSVMEYNETRDMKNYLVHLGVPESAIVEDFAGFSTLDSVIRAKEVFGQKDIIIVSQPFHNERALFIAKHHDMNAIGYNAQAVRINYSIKTHIREYLARVKCLLDVYLWKTMPKFYKQKEHTLD